MFHANVDIKYAVLRISSNILKIYAIPMINSIFLPLFNWENYIYAVWGKNISF